MREKYGRKMFLPKPIFWYPIINNLFTIQFDWHPAQAPYPIVEVT